MSGLDNAPIQRHINNVAVLFNISFCIQPATARSGFRTNGRSDIREGHTHVLLYPTADINPVAFDTVGRA